MYHGSASSCCYLVCTAWTSCGDPSWPLTPSSVGAAQQRRRTASAGVGRVTLVRRGKGEVVASSTARLCTPRLRLWRLVALSGVDRPIHLAGLQCRMRLLLHMGLSSRYRLLFGSRQRLSSVYQQASQQGTTDSCLSRAVPQNRGSVNIVLERGIAGFRRM